MPLTGVFGSISAPATLRWVSTASRAMNSRMISLEPSKIRLMRKSRIMRSTGIGLLAAAPQAVGRLVAAAALDLQRVVNDSPPDLGVPHLGDRRLEPDVGGARSARSEPRSATASMAKMSAAIRPIFCAIASCLPTGWPHCTRSAAQRREISRQRLPPATADAGRVSRPVLRVMSASLRPFALTPEQVLDRHLHVGEADDAVLDRLEPHEVEAMHHLDAGPVGLDDERGDLLGAGARHHHHQLGDGARWCTRASRRSGSSASRRGRAPRWSPGRPGRCRRDSR